MVYHDFVSFIMVLTIGLLSILAGLTCLRLSTVSAQSFPSQETDVSSLLVSSTSGFVQGFLDTTTTSVPLNKWLGIRYAADTSGKNRWRAPQTVVVPGVFSASVYGPACLQGR